MSTTAQTLKNIACLEPVAHVDPVNGWTLCSTLERDGDGFNYHDFWARKGDQIVSLNVSRFRFTPSTERFGWLVRNNFPPAPRFGPWDDTDIEMLLAVERIAA